MNIKERPILFSAPMVRALLAGTKTQTRRAAKLNCAGRFEKAGKQWHPDAPAAVNACPYGQPGDRLWVKKTHRFGIAWDKSKPTEIPTVAAIRYEADGVIRTTGQKLETGKVRPSLFMRQAFSRLTLEITEIRVERLQSISEADAEAEGVTPASRDHTAAAVAYIFGAKEFQAHKSSYATLWEQLNGPGSWALNPWVWVISFWPISQEAPK
jgi:hypothetical protein